jgi:hypothetical protein
MTLAPFMLAPDANALLETGGFGTSPGRVGAAIVAAAATAEGADSVSAAVVPVSFFVSSPLASIVTDGRTAGAAVRNGANA